jgi:hypothetical protein
MGESPWAYEGRERNIPGLGGVVVAILSLVWNWMVVEDGGVDGGAVDLGIFGNFFLDVLGNGWLELL